MGIIGWIILGVIALLLLWAVGIYNRLVRLRALVREGFSGITVQLRRRADLIPNLVESGQGYATHEREVFDEVTAHRADAVKAASVEATAQADAQMTSLLGRLMAVAEAYPDLKANENFLDLQQQLANIETELQGARRYYNATVRDLNSTVQSFPDMLVARPPASPKSRSTRTRTRASRPRRRCRSLARRRDDGRLSRRIRSAPVPRRRSGYGRGANHQLRQRCRGAGRFLARSHRNDRRRLRGKPDPARNLSRFPDSLQRPRREAGCASDSNSWAPSVTGPEPATVEPLSNGVRIRIGRADTLIDPGEHRYVIRYRTTRQIGRFAEFDELYWNATGNGWAFPIETAEARIRLPSPVTFLQHSAYTGPQGSTDSNAQVVVERPGEIVFRTTWPLAPFEGLTVAAAWPKGVVAEPDERTRLGWWLSDHGPPIVGGLGLIAILGFYYVAWQKAGRDPRPGTIVPLFSPPDDMSPAAMRYLVEMNADNRPSPPRSSTWGCAGTSGSSKRMAAGSPPARARSSGSPVRPRCRTRSRLRLPSSFRPAVRSR
jgi:hypothetical protein